MTRSSGVSTRRTRVRSVALRGRSLTAALSLALTSAAGAAQAEAPHLSNEARADLLFHSAEKKFDSGDYAGACADFSESLKLGPKLGTLLNLALCHETIGKFVTAWSEYSHGAVWAAQNNQRDRHEFALQHVRALEPKLPRVVLQLPADRAISGLDLDGEPLPEQRWYLPLYLDPGEHRLAVTAPGKQRSTIAFRVTTSPTDQLVYIPPLLDEKKASPAPPAKAPDPTRRRLGYLGLGVGGAAILTGAIFGVLAMTADARDPVVKDHATVATIAFVGGAALAGVGGWLVWSSRDRTVRSSMLLAPQREGASVWLHTSF